jgi:hypothetical protein
MYRRSTSRARSTTAAYRPAFEPKALSIDPTGALRTVHDALGGLDAVRRVVSLRGVVNASPDFAQHTHVIDGASDLLVAGFGAAGPHARLAVGVSSLPAGLALGIELLVEVDASRAPTRT